MSQKPVVLCILDGWGKSDARGANAPALANTPNFDAIMANSPNSALITHGPDVGLPSGQMGNSEVGHTNIGAGRVVAMDLGQIDLAIENDSFYKNEALINFIETLKTTNGTAHVMGVLSDGGVHGHINHAIAALKALRENDIPTVFHAITDGRDVAPCSANDFATQFLERLPDGVNIGTVTGRYFAMDRDNRWERVITAYNAIIHAKADHKADHIHQAIANAYSNGTTDEFIPATILSHYQGARDNDGFFCLNFRADRAREILSALGAPDFTEFDRGILPKWSKLLGMVEYSDQHRSYMTTCYPKLAIKNTLGEWVAKHGKNQFRLAETEKYPHVTFFLNGGKETPEIGEDRFMPLSPKVATYDLQPEMSAPQVTQKFVSAIEQGYDLIVTNYANPDMVGHTGNLDAAIKACEAVDQGLGEVIAALKKSGGCMILTADHGNCEVMIDPETGGPHTAHTLNLVPVAVFNAPNVSALRNGGRLADLAPTILALMGLEQPDEMTGQSLLE